MPVVFRVIPHESSVWVYSACLIFARLFFFCAALLSPSALLPKMIHLTVLALYSFVNGRIKARVDSHARVGVFIEEGVSQNMSAFICGDLDHLQNKYKFGFGITLQS